MDRVSGSEGGDDCAELISLKEMRREKSGMPVTFHRRELDQILSVYGRMVAANEWRDYAIDHLADRAVFSVFRRASETPLYRITKNPSLVRKQGIWSVTSPTGTILRRGHDLSKLMGFFDNKLKLVQA